MSNINCAWMARAYYPYLFELENKLVTRYDNPDEIFEDLKNRKNDILVYAAYFWITAAVVNETAELKCDKSETSYWDELPTWVERPEQILPMTKEAIRLRLSTFRITDDALFSIAKAFKTSVGLTDSRLRNMVTDATLKLVYKVVEKARLQEIEDIQDTEEYREFQEVCLGIEEVELEKHIPETLNLFDLGLQLTHESTTVSDVLFDRLFEHIPEALESLNIRGTKKELALRGAKMFEYYYHKGMNQDVAALQLIEENKLELREAAIIKNMNKNFVQDRVLGAAGELAVHGVIVPTQAEHLGGNDKPDFILEEKKTIFEVKWRINNSKARSVKWLIENECKYLYSYLIQDYKLHFVYVLYSKQQCEVQQWTLTPVLEPAP